MILITGASGQTGGAVLQAALGLGPRALYRSAAEARGAPAGVATVVADFAEPAGLAGALEGIETVFLVCGPIPQLVELETTMIAASQAAGVRHVVLSSALGAGRFEKSFPSWHAQVEQRLRASGMAYTIIRPNGFMQNVVTYNAASIRADRAFYAAMGDAKTSVIDVRDIGEAVAGILAAPGEHAGQIYELNGPEALSNAEIAARVSAVAGGPIAYVDIPEAAQRAAMLGAGMPDWQVMAILELQEYYRSGACAGDAQATARLLGHEPRGIDAFLQENAAAFTTAA